MRDWYKAGDKKFKALEKESARIFRKSRLTLDFDNINQPVKEIQTEAKRVYRKLKKKSDKAYLDIGLLVYMEAYEEAVAAEAKSQKARDTEPEVGLPVAEISQKSKKAINRKWLNRFHREYNPVTKYVYENELERKQARFFESIVADVEAKDRHGMEADYKTAENAWKRQTRQAMIDTEDRATLTAYRDAGTGEVMWITQRDERVCEECIARNGLIFPIDRVPDKPHYGCRCYIVPVRSDEEIASASPRFLNRNDLLYRNSLNIKPIDGYEDVVVHADKYGFVFKNSDGVESNVSVTEFAEILKKSDVYNGGAIRLIACESAAKGAISAQKLADALGVEVLAPDGVVYVHPDGEMTIGSPLTNNGKWIRIKPRT